MSDESYKETTDTKRLETQIENLRCAIITLIIVVSLLAGYVIIQTFASFGLYVVVVFIVLLIFAFSYATDRM